MREQPTHLTAFVVKADGVGVEHQYLVSVDSIHVLRATRTESEQDGRKERVVRTMIRA